LLKRSAATGMAGQWYLPGGAVDPGETPDEAARRELSEESGLEMEDEPELVGCYFLRMYGHDFLQLTYRAPVTGEVTLSPEHDAAQWTDAADMRAFLSEETIVSMSRGDERIEAMLRGISTDLDRYLRRIGK
jgi:8-oxo-dGTP diphosphatase